MRITRMRGWSITVEKEFVEDEKDNIWTLVFTERMPESGDQIVFEMNRQTRDALVRHLTDGIVLAGGEFPSV